MADLRNIIIILGPRRTGTTLLNQILCSDPDSNPHVGECQLLTKICSTFKWSEENYDRVVQWYFDDRDASRAYFKRQVDGFLEIAAVHLGDVSSLVLKSPELSNFKSELDILLPDAKQIVCIRDPRDQIASELDVGKRQTEMDIDADSGRAYARRDIVQLCRKYLKYYEAIVKGDSKNVMFVRYEDIVLNLQYTLEGVEKFTGLDLSGFNSSAEWSRFEHKEYISKMPAYVEQYGSPIDESRIGRYKKALSEIEVALVERECRSIFDDKYKDLI